MMSLKPRHVDFQETWANLRETVEGVVALRAVHRAEWNTRFSDVYALCVAHPEPLADRLYDETKAFLEQHVARLLRRVVAGAPLASADYTDGLLDRYVATWHEYSQGVAYLNCLYSYLNLQHVKRQKVSDAEIIYGSAATVSCSEYDARQLEVGELGLEIWERVLMGELGAALTARLVGALGAAREAPLGAPLAATVRAAVLSAVRVRAFRVRRPLALYERLVLEPFLAAAAAHHARLAQALLQRADVCEYMRRTAEGLRREEALSAAYLPAASAPAVRAAYERAALAAHLPALHAHAPRLLRDAAAEGARRDHLRTMYALLAPLGAPALRPLVAAAHAHVAHHGRAALHDAHDAHLHFVHAMVALHSKYSELFADVFDGAQAFIGALDKACSEVVNSRAAPDQPARAPELLARYCDTLLRKRSGGEADTEERLSAAITVFKYVDDKDVFQKYYARALARRLIHQLSASMEQEEAMINRLKAACGYEFTNKLHRMFTDVAVSADLNAKFQQHLRDEELTLPTGFSIQVLQAGAWPLGGAMAPLAPPPQLERPARLFEAFYRRAFSGRRLAWLHHLCTGELRTKYTARVYHVSATTAQCALLLAFERAERRGASDLRTALQLRGAAWARHLRPLLDAGLLLADGDVGADPDADTDPDADPEADADADAPSGSLTLNLAFSCKRTKLRLTAANAPAHSGPSGGGGGAGGAEPETAHCDDDRKMYLQAAIVRIMKQRKVVRHTELVAEVVAAARGSFAPSVALIKKCVEALIDKQYLERTPHANDTYSYLA